MKNIIESIRKELKQNADEKLQKNGQIFFKEKINSYGIKTAVVKKIGKDYFKDIKDKNKSVIFELCEDLWKSGYIEESFIACNWSYYLHKSFKKADFKTFENWIEKYVSNWATCDTLCNHTVGALVEMYPALLPGLKKWAKSGNRWMRRAAAVSLIIPARQGKFLKEIFGLADILIQDEDDLVQKGYGWMLKEASRVHQKEIFDYIIKNKGKMPRTALRYAIEKMSEALKRKAMER